MATNGTIWLGLKIRRVISIELLKIIINAMIQKKKKLTPQEFKEILPKHYKYLERTLWEVISKLYAKMCNRGFYHHASRPFVNEVGVFLDAHGNKEIHKLCAWVRIGNKTYQVESEVCPPYIPWFDEGMTKSSSNLKAKTNKKS